MGVMERWQVIITVVVSLINFPAAWNQLAIAVIAPRQDFTCVSPAPFNANDIMLRACYVKVDENSTETVCTKFTYDDSAFKSTIVSEWDLVCDRKYLLSLVQPLMQTDILLGNLGLGIVAHKIGRKTPLMIAVISQAITGIVTSFMATFEVFLAFKTISAVATGGTMLISFVIVMDIIGAEIRSTVLTLYWDF